jgi:hypothetical protein
MKKTLLLVTIMVSTIYSFQFSFPSKKRIGTSLPLQLPNFGAKDDKKPQSDESSNQEKKKSIGLSGLIQVITAGMGAPFLGDFEGVDEETGKFMFSLEANNLVDEVTNTCIYCIAASRLHFDAISS